MIEQDLKRLNRPEWDLCNGICTIYIIRLPFGTKNGGYTPVIKRSNRKFPQMEYNSQNNLYIVDEIYDEIIPSRSHQTHPRRHGLLGDETIYLEGVEYWGDEITNQQIQ